MTLEDAIRHAEKVAEQQIQRIDNLSDIPKFGSSDEDIKLIEKCEECAEEHRQLAEWLRDYKRLKEQEPSGDLISREAVLENAFAIYTHECGLVEVVGVATIKDLPSVKPQERTGHWVVNECGSIYCSSCGCGALYDKVYPGESVFGKAIRVKSTFCPTCGAKMS